MEWEQLIRASLSGATLFQPPLMLQRGTIGRWKQLSVEERRIKCRVRERKGQREGGVGLHRETGRSGGMERIAGRAAEWEGGMLGRKPDQSLVSITMATEMSSLSLTHAHSAPVHTWQRQVRLGETRSAFGPVSCSGAHKHR